MGNYREILKLKSLGYGQMNNASGIKDSRNTVSEVLKKTEGLRIVWSFDNSVTNTELEKLLYPGWQTACITLSRTMSTFIVSYQRNV